jgi:hypothetical protein
MIAQVTADVAGAELGLIAQRKFNDTDLPALKGATYAYDAANNVVKVDTPAETRGDAPVEATVENALDTIALTAAYDFEIVKVTVGGGLSMNNTKELEDVPAAVKDDVEKLTKDLENAFAYAVKVEAPITDEIEAEASYVVKPADWKGNGSNSAVANVKGSYEADALAVNASFTTTGKPVNDPETDDNRTTTIALDGSYDFANDITAKLAVEHKIEKDKHAAIEENINTTKITADVSAPIVEGLVSVAANVGYTFDNLGAIQVGTYVANPAGFAQTTALAKRNHSAFALAKSVFDAGATFTVTPMDKLTLKPAVSFKSFKDGNKDVVESAAIRAIRNATQHTHFIPNDFTAGSIITLKADATYAVGGGATITLSAGNDSYNFTAINGADATLKYNNPFASAAVKVVF